MTFELQFPISDDALTISICPSYIDALEMATDLFGDGLVLDEVWAEPGKAWVYAHRLLRDGQQIAVIVVRKDLHPLLKEALREEL